jgi:hypothetical protein
MAVKEIPIDASDKYIEKEVKSVEAEIDLMKMLSMLAYTSSYLIQNTQMSQDILGLKNLPNNSIYSWSMFLEAVYILYFQNLKDSQKM